MSKKSNFKRLTAIAAFAAGAAFATGASAGLLVEGWHAWAVGTGTSTDAAGTVTFHAGRNLDSSGNEVDNWDASGINPGNKAFYSTGALNGERVGILESLSYNCVSGCQGTPLNSVYTNIFIVDPNDSSHRAMLLPVTITGIDTGNYQFGNVLFRVNETSDSTWLANTSAGTDLTWNQVKDYIIGNGVYAAMVDPNAGWPSSAGTDGFWLVWGNRSGLAHYDPDQVISDVKLYVPEPGTLALLGLGLAGLGFGRRKVAA